MHESRPSLGTRKSASVLYHTCLCWSFTSRILTAKITPVTFASTSLLPPRTERTSIILASTKWARVVLAKTHSLTSLSQVCKTRGYIPYMSSYYYRDRPCNYISRACLFSLRNQHSRPLRFVWCSCSWPVFSRSHPCWVQTCTPAVSQYPCHQLLWMPHTSLIWLFSTCTASGPSLDLALVADEVFCAFVSMIVTSSRMCGCLWCLHATGSTRGSVILCVVCLCLSVSLSHRS